MSLVGEQMRDFRKELLEAPVPKNLKELAKVIIPPKGIKRKNIEGAELLDNDDESDDEDDDMDVSSESDEEEEDVDVESEAENNEEDTIDSAPENTMIGDQIALTGLSSDDDINRDAKFLDAMAKLIHEQGSDTTIHMQSFISNFQATLQNARRNVKQRISNK